MNDEFTYSSLLVMNMGKITFALQTNYCIKCNYNI